MRFVVLLALGVLALSACGDDRIRFDSSTARLSCVTAVKQQLSIPEDEAVDDPKVDTRDNVHYTVRGVILNGGTSPITYGCTATKTGDYTHTLTVDRIDIAQTN